ncbi:MAG TPA: hypothetical protein PKC73_00590 [Dermatophilaceae bacterium]|jgi:hypothetical protein|nr:hypothetical protein [Dermatophilaceae bacterium]
MVVRFRKYTSPRTGEVTAIKLTPDNVAEVVAYITKNKGTALDESILIKSPVEYLAVKVALVQKNTDAKGKVRKGVRKAFRGDFIVRTEVVDAKGKKGYEFSRVRDAGVNDFVAV